MPLPSGVSRRRALALLTTALPTCLAWVSRTTAADPVLIEDWSTSPLGVRGIPAGWRGRSWTRSAYDLTVEVDRAARVLHLRSHGDATLISKALAGQVDLRQTPILEWRWKAVVLPAGGDARRRAVDDQAVQVYVIWPRPPEMLRSQIIGYIWDSTAPAEMIIPSESTRTVTYVVLRSGPELLGRWLTERRDVREDYRRIHRAEPESPGAVALAIDSNDTGSVAESYVGELRFVGSGQTSRVPIAHPAGSDGSVSHAEQAPPF